MHTNGVYDSSIRSNPRENLFLIISNKNEQTLELTSSLAQRDLRTPQAKAVRFCCWTGICKTIYFLYDNNDVYTAHAYFL